MVTKTKNDRMAWFKMDAGSFIADTTGFSNNEVGMYARLMVTYWASGNKLPTEDHQIQRKVSAVEENDKRNLDLILDEFFPVDDQGKRCHSHLDFCLQDIADYSKQQSDRGKLAHAKRQMPIAIPIEDQEDF